MDSQTEITENDAELRAKAYQDARMKLLDLSVEHELPNLPSLTNKYKPICQAIATITQLLGIIPQDDPDTRELLIPIPRVSATLSIEVTHDTIHIVGKGFVDENGVSEPEYELLAPSDGNFGKINAHTTFFASSTFKGQLEDSDYAEGKEFLLSESTKTLGYHPEIEGYSRIFYSLAKQIGEYIPYEIPAENS